MIYSAFEIRISASLGFYLPVNCELFPEESGLAHLSPLSPLLLPMGASVHAGSLLIVKRCSFLLSHSHAVRPTPAGHVAVF